MEIQIHSEVLGETKWYEYAVRFLFGGLITALAGIIAKKFGPGHFSGKRDLNREA